MTGLLDTQLLVWTVDDSHRLSRAARQFVLSPHNELAFSSASIWELSIKAKRRPDIFRIDVQRLRDSLSGLGYRELSITSTHGLAAGNLPMVHKDPFDRMLIAQAITEGMMLATVDQNILRYDAPTLDLS